MINGDGELCRAYKDDCANYDPDKEKPTTVVSEKSGRLFKCRKYDNGENPDQGCFWCVNKLMPNV